MNINIKATNVTLSESISNYVDKRMDKISKLLSPDPTTHCDLELARTTSHHQKGPIFKAEVHIVGAGKNLYATAEREDLYTAIDMVRDDILKELKVNKDKEVSFMRRSGAKMKAMAKGLWPFRK